MYLSKMTIKGFRGIKDMSIEFNKNINIIIGENGAYKSTIIDAMRLLYSLGDPFRSIYITDEDFHSNLITGESVDKIELSYEFRELSEKEKGALYQYVVIKEQEVFAAITIMYTRRDGKQPKFDYYTGANPGQKADSNTFEIFQHYYLSALRDSTSDLLQTRANPLGRVIHRSVERNKTGSTYTSIVEKANKDLLNLTEVTKTKGNINTNLSDIHTATPQIDLHIEQTKPNYIVNAIKPFLPFSEPITPGAGLTIRQNSLGHNNLVYIATVLGDMSDRITSEEIIHFALLIEEPEAHLHPQLQLNLYNFLKKKNSSDSCQLFITTHSPTVTSRVELDNMLVVVGQSVTNVGHCFRDRELENLEDNGVKLTTKKYELKKKMLERYIDVTKSQMFYAKALLMVEGISEELLFSAFAQVEGFRLEERDVELVQTGTSFYPFLFLFNSNDERKRLSQRIAVVTDDDRFTDSKKPDYSFSKLVENDYALLNSLYEAIKDGEECSRISNLEHTRNARDTIKICKAYKTLEYELAHANIPNAKTRFKSNMLIEYLCESTEAKFVQIDDYLQSCDDNLTDTEKKKVAILVWKLMPDKAGFAQGFATYLIENLTRAKTDFCVPKYICDAFEHLTGNE